MDQVSLLNASDYGLSVLREITGVEEQAITGTTTLAAIQLLEKLLVHAHSGSLKCGGVNSLSAWDRDRMLAAVYIRTYGPRVESTIHCLHCREVFDLDFSLQQLLEALKEDSARADVEALDDGTYCFADGLQFRLPTGEDECALMGLSPEDAEQELLYRCTPDKGGDFDIRKRAAEIQSAMAAVAPVIDLELDAECQECGQVQKVHFDLQHYLLSALQGERPRLMHEIHALALNYGWSLTEILHLPRSQRRALASLVDAEQ